MEQQRNWAKIFQHLAQDSDNEYQMMDTTVVRAYQHSAGVQNSDKKTNPKGYRSAYVLVAALED